jgi:MFS family permease
MIFEQSGIGTDASFMQAVLVGLVNLVFTVLAIMFIDKLGRRPLLIFGLVVIASCMFLLAYGFGSATYTIDEAMLATLPPELDTAPLLALAGEVFNSDVAFRQAVTGAIGAEAFTANQSALVSGAIDMNPTLILFGILGFVAGFAISLGPVMWVLFSELFPNRIRGVAISFVGLINSGVSFLVQLLFPWELENLGNAMTFLIFGLFAVVGLLIVLRILPETKGKSLEQLESELVPRTGGTTRA